MVDMREVQNYYLSFFAGVQAPKGETAEEIEKEVEQDAE